MGHTTLQPWSARAWDLARKQHGVVARTQLLTLGLSRDAIRHRIGTGRLHPLWRGVYAVGRPDVDERGRLMGAVLACGPTARLSHRSAAALWGMQPRHPPEIEISVSAHVARRRPGIRVHRQSRRDPARRCQIDRIPVMDPVATLVDLASCVSRDRLEAAVNEADRLDLTDPEVLRVAIERHPRRPGLERLRALLDRRTFTVTHSSLERRFIPLARAAGLPIPETQVWVNGFRVDFYWQALGLVVESDGLRYHRTPAQQARDHRRDQAHAAAGLTALRFSHAQVYFEGGEVRATLAAVASRLQAGA